MVLAKRVKPSKEGTAAIIREFKILAIDHGAYSSVFYYRPAAATSSSRENAICEWHPFTQSWQPDVPLAFSRTKAA
jgi:hypothetical protein